MDQTISDTQDLLIGDTITVSPVATVSKEVSDDLKVQILVEDPTGLNSTLESSDFEIQSGEATARFSLDVAGTWKAATEVLSISEDEENIIETVNESLMVFDFEAMARNLFYERRMAFETSTQEGLNFNKEHNYPGLYNYEHPDTVAQTALFIEYKYWDRLSLASSNLQPHDSWIHGDVSCLVKPITKPLEGRIFLASVTQEAGENLTGYQFPSSTYDLHLALLNGKLYIFIPMC